MTMTCLFTWHNCGKGVLMKVQQLPEQTTYVDGFKRTCKYCCLLGVASGVQKVELLLCDDKMLFVDPCE
jgi:hypothetical protein